MKKIFFTALAALCISTAAFSQKGTTEVGVGIGYNAATVSVSNSNVNLSADYRNGVNGAVSVEHYFSDTWGFKAKAIYDQKGWANGYYSTGFTSYDTDYHLDYVTVPLMANWHFGRTKNWYLNFGPYVAFLLSAKASYNGSDVKSAFNTVDGGLDVGIGIKFPVTDNVKFFIEFNGQSGVGNVAKGTGPNYRSGVTAFNVGLNFR